MTSQVEVGLTRADPPDLERLARACLDRDGGLPSFAHETMLDSRLLRDQTIGLRLADGTLAAAAGIGHKEGTATTSGMVHPTERHRGIGNRHLRWAIEKSGDATLLVETETCSADADSLYARHGLVRISAESVMRHDLPNVPVYRSRPEFASRRC